jgi:capsular polysaccharide export protein
MVRTAASRTIGDTELDAAIEAIAAARVGGEYWALQPQLPESPYTLIRVRGAEVRSSLLQSLQGDATMLCWVDAMPREPSLQGSAISFVSGPCDPWHLVSGAQEIVTDPDDELVAIAALAGRAAHVPDGRGSTAPSPGRDASLDGIRLHLASCAYANPFTGEAMSLSDAIKVCAHWRQLIDSNRSIAAAVGFAAWKKATAAPLLWAGSTGVPFTTRLRGIAAGDQVAAWKSRVGAATLAELGDRGAQLVEVEDGFIRSVGLGADCVPPLSLVVDRLGAYFDPQRPSELELMLQNGSFPRELLDRARRLRKLIVEVGVSKYDIGQHAVERRAGRRRHILVPGQVEDDRSVLCGGGPVRSNLDLLSRARSDAPDAYIIYKPHPDVEAGHRLGAVSEGEAGNFADEIVRGQPISSLIDMVDEVHVNTSLAGFEALMRGKPVTTHGVPFYAGWGLTRDLGAVPERRTATRTLDELVAAVLLLYPRYLDPVTGLPCTPEILIRRLVEGAGSRSEGPWVPLRRLQGYMKRRVTSLREWRSQ